MYFNLIAVLLSTQYIQSISSQHERILVEATAEIASYVCKNSQIAANLVITRSFKEDQNSMDFLSDLLMSISSESNCEVRIRLAHNIVTPHPSRFSIFLINSIEFFYEYYSILNSETFNFRKFFLLVLLNANDDDDDVGNGNLKVHAWKLF